MRKIPKQGAKVPAYLGGGKVGLIVYNCFLYQIYCRKIAVSYSFSFYYAKIAKRAYFVMLFKSRGLTAKLLRLDFCDVIISKIYRLSTF